ncbi:hypothetical protein CON38_16255 [Bacillus cereus]|nr:hypothetical protein CON38_16255 [Bacillus cereus]
MKIKLLHTKLLWKINRLKKLSVPCYVMKNEKEQLAKANCSVQGISPRGNGENIMLLALLTDY